MYYSNKIIEEYQQKVANRLTGMLVEVTLKEVGISNPTNSMIN